MGFLYYLYMSIWVYMFMKFFKSPSIYFYSRLYYNLVVYSIWYVFSSYLDIKLGLADKGWGSKSMGVVEDRSCRLCTLLKDTGGSTWLGLLAWSIDVSRVSNSIELHFAKDEDSSHCSLQSKNSSSSSAASSIPISKFWNG